MITKTAIHTLLGCHSNSAYAVWPWESEDFNHLEGQDVAQFVRWITHQYNVDHKSGSGDKRARFEDRVGEKSYYLHCFHNMITSSGAENIESLMKAELSLDLFAESSVNRLLSSGGAQDCNLYKKHTYPISRHIVKKRGPFLSNTKEQETDIAILWYITRAKDGQQNKESFVVSNGGTLHGPLTSTSRQRHSRCHVHQLPCQLHCQTIMRRRSAMAIMSTVIAPLVIMMFLVLEESCFIMHCNQEEGEEGWYVVAMLVATTK